MMKPSIDQKYEDKETGNHVYKITAVGLLFVLMVEIEDKRFGLNLWPPRWEKSVSFEELITKYTMV